MKWLLKEITVAAITVLVIVPLLLVMVAGLPFYALWAACVDDDGLEEM